PCPAGTYGDVRVEPLERFPAEVDEIWRAAAPGYGNHVIRDAQFLNWRYADTPRTYRRLGAYRDGRLRAVAIVGHTVKQGVSSGGETRIQFVHDHTYIAESGHVPGGGGAGGPRDAEYDRDGEQGPRRGGATRQAPPPHRDGLRL